MHAKKPTTKKAIVTQYRGATNTRGSTIIARAYGVRSVVVPFDCEFDSSENHTLAAKALLDKYGWIGAYVAGGMPDGNSVVFVCADFSPAITIGDQS